MSKPITVMAGKTYGADLDIKNHGCASDLFIGISGTRVMAT